MVESMSVPVDSFSPLPEWLSRTLDDLDSAIDLGAFSDKGRMICGRDVVGLVPFCSNLGMTKDDPSLREVEAAAGFVDRSDCDALMELRGALFLGFLTP